jgi:hypothetical protein
MDFFSSSSVVFSVCISMNELKNRKYYDESFAEVFSNRKMLESLLRDFVEGAWINHLDFTSMTIERSIFKEICNSPRENDLLLSFEVRGLGSDRTNDRPAAKDGHNAPRFRVFVLIEFQSTPAKMVARLLEYRHRLQTKMVKSMGALFPVIPIVIYSGSVKWRENPESGTGGFPQPAPEGLAKYTADTSYILIDEQSYSDEFSLGLGNPAAYFFYIDKTDLRDRAGAAERIIRVLSILKQQDPEISDLLKRYVLGLLEYRGVELQSNSHFTHLSLANYNIFK